MQLMSSPRVCTVTSERSRPVVVVITALAMMMATLTAMLIGPVSSAQAAALTDLKLVDTDITMRPAAIPNTFNNVAPAATTQTHVLATFADGSATYTVDGGGSANLTSDDSSAPIALHPGLTTIVVTHTAADTTVTTYTVYVRNQVLLTNIEVETPSGVQTLSPVFDPTTFSYSISVPHDDTQARIRSTWNTSPDPSISGLSYSIGWGPGGGTTSGTWSNYAALSVGSGNRWCPTLVASTAVSSIPQVGVGYPDDRYCITITRADAFSSTTLSSVTFDDSLMQTQGGELRSTGVPYEFYSYPQWGATQTQVTATFSVGTATYSVDGVSVGALTSGVASAPISLHDGVNDVVITHTNGSTVTTYTIHVLSRQLLQNMEIETGTGTATVSPAFDPNVFSYTVTVPHDDTVARIRSTWNTSPDPSISGLSYSIGWGPGGGTTSGTWSNYAALSVGSGNRWCPTLVASTAVSSIPQVGVGYPDDRYCITITRASAFAAITSVTLPGVPAVGTPVPAGSAISVTPSGVAGEPAPTVTYDWEAADDTTFTTTTVVATTTTPSWTPDNSVADKFVRVTATADNGISTPTTVTSSSFGPIAAVNAAPTIASAAITGTAQVGVTLSAGVTGLTGYPAPTVTFQWESAPDGSSPFTTVGTGATYTPSSGDLGSVLRVVATATNGVGTAATATSSATAAVIAGSGGSSNTPAPPVPPGVPSNVQVIPGDESVTVSWDAPVNAGAFPVSTYQVLTQGGSQLCLTKDTTCVIEGLTNGTEYSFRVRALSGSGWSTWSVASQVAVPGSSSIMISGVRADVRGRPGIIVSGVAHGLAPDAVVHPWFKFPGHTRYRPGIARIRIDESGEFTWQRRTGKKIYVSLRSADGEILSNRLIVRRR